MPLNILNKKDLISLSSSSVGSNSNSNSNSSSSVGSNFNNGRMLKKTQEKINSSLGSIFGLSMVSLIAACSAEGAGKTSFSGSDDTPKNPPNAGKTNVSLSDLLVIAKDLDAVNEPSVSVTASGGSGLTVSAVFSGGFRSSVDAYFHNGVTDNNHVDVYSGIGNLGDSIVFYSRNFYKAFIQAEIDTETSYAGRVFVLWGVSDGVSLSSLQHLSILGGYKSDVIGTFKPQIAKVNDDDNYDMMLKSSGVSFVDDSGSVTGNVGGVYFIWNINQYESSTAEFNIILSESSTENVLSIYGALAGDQIGISDVTPLRLHDNSKYDLVFSSSVVDKDAVDVGGIYILWDIGSYSASKKTIVLGSSEAKFAAEAGILSIYGATTLDQLGGGNYDFTHVDGNLNFDMVIHSQFIDAGFNDGLGTHNNGAIYVIWNVGDYAADAAGNPTNTDITIDNPATALHGLLSIIGSGSNINFSKGLEIIFNTDAEGNHSLIDIDGNGSKDIAFKQDKYTYVLFGEEVAEIDTNGKVASKTVDLAAIEAGIGDSAEDFFSYDFTAQTAEATPAEADRVGYRFVDKNYANVTDIKTNFPDGLSDADADLGVWDIA